MGVLEDGQNHYYSQICRKEEIIWGLVIGDRKKFGLEARDRKPEELLGEGIQVYVDRLWKRGSRRYHQIDLVFLKIVLYWRNCTEVLANVEIWNRKGNPQVRQKPT